MCAVEWIQAMVTPGEIEQICLHIEPCRGLLMHTVRDYCIRRSPYIAGIAYVLQFCFR
jgi:hypothetical protein